MGPVPKSTRCAICNQTFSRSDHLKRHQLRHSGLKPYCCAFCRQPFTRSDLLKSHYRDCPRRGEQPIPEPARQGRRSHACDSCTVAKLGCDGNAPCSRCNARGISCSFARIQPLKPANDLDQNPSTVVLHGSPHIVEEPSKKTPSTRIVSESNPFADRGSIKFLLNGGTASFIECFRFPSTWERKNLDDLKSSANDTSDGSFPGSENLGTYDSSSLVWKPGDHVIDWSIFDNESFIRFFNSPFGEGEQPMSGPFAGLQKDSQTNPGQRVLPASPTAFSQPEAGTGVAANITSALLNAASTLHMNDEESAEVLRHVQYLYTLERTEKLCNMYWEFWHPNCPILHRPSFNMNTIPTALLVPITLMGAMYSTVDKEVSTAKVLLDLAEVFVFSVEDLRDDFEIEQVLRLSSSRQRDRSVSMSPSAFDNVRAAHLMICVQFWAGNPLAKRRVVESRFGVSVKVVRRLGLTKAKHEHYEDADECNWIRMEARIRTISIMVLLDCAFTFFANFPCRFTLAELDFDLPCDPVFFNSPRPFTEAGFSIRRPHTIILAFRSLFEQNDHQLPLGKTTDMEANRQLDFNCMDMFILIHLLYVSAHTYVTMFSPQRPRIDGKSSGNSTPTAKPDRAFIESALVRWRTFWIAMRAKTSNREWANLGFFTNGYHFWLVIQLLITHPGSSDLLKGMPINCEDTLKHLRTLLRDPTADM